MTLPIHITPNDLRKLRELIRVATQQGGADLDNLKRLEAELERASVVEEAELPDDVIVMNSTAELENLDRGGSLVYTLVYPEMADVDEGRISVLAPLGMAMIGYRVGDEFEWPTPGGTIRFRVKRLSKSGE